MSTKPQCKDIGNAQFLNAVALVCKTQDRNVASRWDVGAVLAGFPEFVQPMFGFPYGMAVTIDYNQLFPQKLIIAKARKLIRRGLLTGCYCGCRGDFMPTDLTIVGDTIYKRSEV